MLSVALLVALVITGSCVRRLLAPETAEIWIPAPVSGAPAFATPEAEILPTVAQRPAAATPTRQAPTVPTTQPTITPAPALAATATPDPNLVIIMEADIAAMAAAGAGGATLEGLTVRFADERMTFRADRLRYGDISVADLTLIGRLVAKAGKLELMTESVTPRGLVTALIPVFVNQALAQYTAQWYIEEARTLDGRLELRIR